MERLRPVKYKGHTIYIHKFGPVDIPKTKKAFRNLDAMWLMPSGLEEKFDYEFKVDNNVWVPTTARTKSEVVEEAKKLINKENLW